MLLKLRFVRYVAVDLRQEEVVKRKYAQNVNLFLEERKMSFLKILIDGAKGVCIISVALLGTFMFVLDFVGKL